MTDLPEDLSRWPSDPFVLLNLDRNADARTARRAYFRLVRKYQPDRFPAEFQKVREAYEEVENWLKWRNIDTDDDRPPAQNRDNDFETVERSSIDSDASKPSFEDERTPVDQDSEGPVRSSILVDPFEQFLDFLESGEIANAVATMNQVDVSAGPAQVAKACLVKYYLSRFFSPTTDSPPATPFASLGNATDSSVEEERISWLLKSMDSAEYYTSAFAQLKIEFDRNYRLAVCRVVTNYLATITDCVKLADLYRLRWEAIGHYDARTVVDDLSKLQPRSLEFGNHRSVWLNLVAETMNYTVWHAGERCVKHNRECWQELSECGQAWTADSVELLILAAEEWKLIRGLFKWSAAIPWARSTLPESSRRIWMPIAKEIAADPRTSLKMLNLRFQNSSIAMVVFEEGLQQLAVMKSESESSFAETWEETRDLVACFFGMSSQTDYVSNRVAVMEFCILNQLSPINFARAADTLIAPESTIGWTDLVQNDGPLLCVVNACHAANQ